MGDTLITRIDIHYEKPVRLLVGKSLADVEKDLILATLAHCVGNRTRTAVLLGCSPRTLRNKLKLYGADDGADDGTSDGHSPDEETV